MRNLIAFLAISLIGPPILYGKVVVFWQDGFPTVASPPVSRATLVKALAGEDTLFAGIAALEDPSTLKGADLLILPYGSSVPVDGWSRIHGYLRAGGNLLVLGGQALRIPVSSVKGKFIEARPQDTYSRELDIRHTYVVPSFGPAKFAWKPGYSFLPAPEIRARRFFALEGRLEGLGYMTDSAGTYVAAPVVVLDHTSARRSNAMPGSRIVLLDFEPEDGYWESEDGVRLIHESAEYARQGAVGFWLEVLFSTLKPGEPAQITVHLRNARRERLSLPLSGSVKVELLSGDAVLDSVQIPCAGSIMDTQVFFRREFSPGFYSVRGLYEDAGKVREFCRNGFWVEDDKLITSGPALGVRGDFLTRDGEPFLPVGTNYFTTEENGWDFSGPRNAWVWERDFEEMANNGVTFVRTGVWMPSSKFIEPSTAAANERFLRNLEAYLLSARRHNIIVNFTFFAFAPRTATAGQTPGPVANPYTDPGAIRAEQDYVLSIVNRFREAPWLCWDLINEPSFSNPNRLWKGNTPNGDPTETAAWHTWLRERYRDLAELAEAWSVTPEQLGSFDAVPLPSEQDLSFARYRNAREVRALDYNLFAQDMFSRWVRSMVAAIRGTGSRQLINVGQDEGGVADRVLNQFYATAGVSFTTNHSYWRDDALLWDSVVAKRPGVPNIIGETGYQPVWAPDGTWRYDEITGRPLLERKWALGFAAANSGVLSWQWAREPDFGMKRSDGSAKIWQYMMRSIAGFAAKTSAWATEVFQPEIAIVLPQSLQLSVLNARALEAQHNSVRALYQYARSEAYAVGEYQIETLGDPKLIILPSPFGLTPAAWQAIRGKVEEGATLLASGPFDGDAHFLPTGRHREAGLVYDRGHLTARETLLKWPEGEARLTYGGDKTTFLDCAVLPDGGTWAEKKLGKGRILFAPLPLEMNDNLAAVGSVYRYAMKVAGVMPTYSTAMQDPGMLICPTRFARATLYVLTSESLQRDVDFHDQRSGRRFSGVLEPGRAALLLVGTDGDLIASYNWTAR